MNGELDTDVLHAGMPAVDTKWVSQVWIRKSFREDGQPSSPVPVQDQALLGPLHEGLYQGLSMYGDDIHEAVMTFEEAKPVAISHRNCQGFTYKSAAGTVTLDGGHLSLMGLTRVRSARREPNEPTRVWFKSKLNVLYSDKWWTYSTGSGM